MPLLETHKAMNTAKIYVSSFPQIRSFLTKKVSEFWVGYKNTRRMCSACYRTGAVTVEEEIKNVNNIIYVSTRTEDAEEIRFPCTNTLLRLHTYITSLSVEDVYIMLRILICCQFHIIQFVYFY